MLRLVRTPQDSASNSRQINCVSAVHASRDCTHSERNKKAHTAKLKHLKPIRLCCVRGSRLGVVVHHLAVWKRVLDIFVRKVHCAPAAREDFFTCSTPSQCQVCACVCVCCVCVCVRERERRREREREAVRECV